MANERNKILPYALSAIEGVNIQSQEDYTASVETSDGVSTGLANGNNFNKLAKQVSIMSSSLAEFIVNTLAEQTISDTNSIEEISSALNNAVLKLIKDNEPVIPDQPGIKVIDANNTDITSFNQITENGIYYIYKKLTDNPYTEILEDNPACITLIVIDVKEETYNIDYTMQLISLNTDGFLMYPSNIGVYPKSRYYNKTDSEWSIWYNRFGLIFNKNNIMLDEFAAGKSNIRFPIIAEDTTFDVGYDTFMYSATKEQMREQLGIADSPDLTDYFNKKKDKIDLETQVENILGGNNGGLGVALTKSDARGIFWVNLGSTETDVNSIIKSGFYQCFNWKNYPTGASNTKRGALWNFSWNDNKDGNSSGFGYQLYITAVGQIWGRYRNNSVFSDWKKMLDYNGKTTVNAGGTGADNADDARTNLQAMQFYIAKTGINNDLNNITNTCVIRFNGSAVNGPGSTWGHAICYYHRNQNKYQTYISWDGSQYMRVCQGASSGSTNFGPWKKILNADGTIPSDAIPPTVLTYTNDVGTWTETKLSDGTTMLEGFGVFTVASISSLSSYTKLILLPKSISDFGLRYFLGINWEVRNTEAAYIPYRFCKNSSSIRPEGINVTFFNQSSSTFNNGNVQWYFRGILA